MQVVDRKENRAINLVPMMRQGFTLVELLIVIAIIGILMGIAVPAIFGVIGTAKSNKQRLEIGAIEQALERYSEKYGDYPPDFSDWSVVERHYRKIFPRIAQAQLDLLETSLQTGGVYDPTKMDRGESLVWALGGYSSNPINPFTGDGGPLVQIPNAAPGTYQVNLDRDNSFYEFDTTRLDLSIADKNGLINASNYYASGDSDLFPHYAAADDGAPFVYFDARTYSFGGQVTGNSFTSQLNGYAHPEYGNVRPYFSTQQTRAGDSFQFVNADTFQVIGPGLDNGFGTLAFDPQQSDLTRTAVYFQYPTGKAVQLERSVNSGAEERLFALRDDVSRYQEPVSFNLVDNFQQDNLTNFADGKLIDELQE